MIDLRVAQPTLVEAADGGGGGVGLPEMREKKDRIQMRAYTASLTQVVIFTPSTARLRDIIHGAEVNYSEVKLYFAQDGYF